MLDLTEHCDPAISFHHTIQLWRVDKTYKCTHTNRETRLGALASDHQHSESFSSKYIMFEPIPYSVAKDKVQSGDRESERGRTLTTSYHYMSRNDLAYASGHYLCLSTHLLVLINLYISMDAGRVWVH